MISFLVFLLSIYCTADTFTEIIEATPVDIFSERAQLWPVTETKVEPSKALLPIQFNLLENTPGVQTKGFNQQGISIRGSGQTGRVLGLYDDIPLNFGDGYGPQSILLPSETIERIYLIKGPASTFYGTSSMGGAVQFVPRHMDQSAFGYQIGAYDKIAQNSFYLGAPVVNKQTNYASVHAFYSRDSGEYPYVVKRTGQKGTRDDNRTELQRYTLQAAQKLGEWKTKQDLVIALQNSSSPGSVAYAYRNTYDNWAMLSALRAKTDLQENVSIQMMSSYALMNSTIDPKSDNKKDVATSRLYNSVSINHIDQRNWKTNFVADWTFNDLKTDYSNKKYLNEHELNAGFIFSVPFWQNYYFEPSFRYLFNEEDFVKAIGFFRRDNFSNVWLTFSEGVRRPSLNDKFSQGFGYQPNPDLQNEKAQQYELGFQLQQSDNLSPHDGWLVGGSVYQIHYDDFIERQSLAGSDYTKNNIGSAQVFGTDWKLSYSWPLLTLTFDYNYLDAREKSHQRMRLSPEHQIAAGATHYFGFLALNFGFKRNIGMYDYDVNQTQATRLPDWSQVDFSITTVGLAQWQVQVGVDNLTNEAKEFVLNYPEPQRRYYVQVLHFF